MIHATQAGAGRALHAFGVAPDEIMALSLQRLRERAAVELPPEPAATVALRMAYAAGDPDLLRDIVVPVDAVHAASSALQKGCAVVCDVAMVAAGVRTIVARHGCEVLCAQDASSSTSTAPHATPATHDAVQHSTRTARGMLALAERWQGAVVVIGNAPTALLALLDALADGAPRPAAIVATPCGLVAAEESKSLLLQAPPAPSITVNGTRGGSAVAAAAVNACALLTNTTRAPQR